MVWSMTSQWRHILSPSTSHLAYATLIPIFCNIGAFQGSRYSRCLTLSVADFVKFGSFLGKNVHTKLRFSRWRNEIIEISGSAIKSSNDCLPSVVDLFLVLSKVYGRKIHLKKFGFWQISAKSYPNLWRHYDVIERSQNTFRVHELTDLMIIYRSTFRSSRYLLQN